MTIYCLKCKTKVDLEEFCRFSCPKCGYINDYIENLPKYIFGGKIEFEEKVAVLPISNQYLEQLPKEIQEILKFLVIPEQKMAIYNENERILKSFLGQDFHGVIELIHILMKKSGVNIAPYIEPDFLIED